MTARLRLIAIAAVLLIPVAAGATTVAVHADIDATKLDAATLELIYLGKKTLWDSGQRITPALVAEDSQTSKAFLETVLAKSVDQYRAYWKRRLFSGSGAVPKTFRTSAEVVDFVARTPGAVGIVDTGAKDDRVKIVNIGH
jgi:ABC-type phosphate transport system substrate-binding protein